MMNIPSLRALRQLGQGMTEFVIIVMAVGVGAVFVYTQFGDVLRGQTAAGAKALAGQSGEVQTASAQEAANAAAGGTSRNLGNAAGGGSGGSSGGGGNSDGGGNGGGGDNFTDGNNGSNGNNGGSDGGEGGNPGGSPLVADNGATPVCIERDCEGQCIRWSVGGSDNRNVGMMGAAVQALLAGLTLSDTPLAYRPAKGPSVPLTFVYSHREAYQPEEFHYSNLGPKWTYTGIAYIVDAPQKPGYNVQRYMAGGGTRKFKQEHFDPATGAFAADTQDMSVLTRMPGKAVKYERRLTNGGLEIYAHSDGKANWPRRLFLTEQRDAAGNALKYRYDDKNRLLSITDASNKRIVLEYRHADPLKITGIKDPAGRRAEISYDERGRLKSIRDAVGLVSKVGYRGMGTFVERLETPYGVSTFDMGEEAGLRWVELTDALGRTARVESRAEASIPEREAAAPVGFEAANRDLHRYNTFYWDAESYAKHKGDYTKAQIRHWLIEDGQAVSVPASVKQPLDSRVWYAYQDQKSATSPGSCPHPSKIARVLPDGTTQLDQMTYNKQGQLTRHIDPLGRETVYEYAANGIDRIKARQKSGTGYDTLQQITWNAQRRPLTVTDAAGQTTQYTYNKAGQLTRQTNALGGTEEYRYDEAGRLVQILNGHGRTQASFTRDAAGNIASMTDSEGYTVKHDYDKLNRRTKTTYPDGTTAEVTWGKLDVAHVKDRSGKFTHYQYDAARNLIEIKDPLRTLQFGYDAASRLVTLTDGNGNTTRWQRDLQGRVTGKYTPDNVKTLYTYDSAGRIARRTDASGQKSLLAHGRDNRLIGVSYQDAREPTPEIRLRWDAHYPRLSVLSDGTGETHYRYGPVGQPDALRLTAIENPSADALQLRYGKTGRIEGWRLGAAGEDYVFDALGRVTGNSNNALGEFNYGYQGDTGQLVKAALSGTPIEHSYGYEPNTGDRRLKAIGHPEAARSFTYSNAPNFIINAMTEALQGQSSTWAFGYDGVGRLQSANRNGESYQYGHDAADNLIRVSTPEGAWDYRHGTGNKVQKDFYQYDPVGNRTGDDRHRYTWDAENRLIKIAYKNAPNKSTEFKYDGQSKRVAIIETDGSKKTETRYTWCGNSICQARNEKNQPVAYYFGQGVYRPQANGNKKEYYARDHLGSIRDVLDEKGNSLARYDYDPYGNLINKPAKQPEFGYAGMQYHAESGLYLTKYRAYDPQSGRWLSRDPIEEAGGINLYAYVEGNPVSFIDPLGLLVTGTYDHATGLLTITDIDTGESAFSWAFSGSESKLPIPNGVYAILSREGRDNFFRLEAYDERFGDDHHGPTGRRLFRLHHRGSGQSDGCIAADNDDGWAAVQSLILATQTDTVTVNRGNQRGGAGIMNRVARRTEPLTRYGTITVINSPN
jgi:RHS repeat-associated protein